MGGDEIVVLKATLQFKIYPQTIYKTKWRRQMKKNQIKEESYLYYTTIIKYAFCFLIFYFSSDKLAKHT